MSWQWNIDVKDETIAATGWCTLRDLVSIKQDSELNIPALKALLKRVEKNIHSSENCVKRAMNGFMISLGSYVVALTDDVIAASQQIGDVEVNVGDTACKTPNAAEYILKVKNKGSLGKKKKMARC